jgi:regulator of RNase E activity RraA
VTDLSSMFTSVAVSHVDDALAHIGYTNTVLRGIGPVTRPGLKMAGHATILELVPARTNRAQRRLSAFLRDTVSPGSIVVVAAHGITDYVSFGERAASVASVRGAVGAVIDGGVRDISELLQGQFPVFAVGRGIHASEGFLEGIRIDETVICGGVKIDPGDWIVADDTGVVVVPADVAEKVAALAVEREELDKESLVEVAGGATGESTHRHFRDDNTEWMRQVE